MLVGMPNAATANNRYRFVILALVWSSYLVVYIARLGVGPLAPFLRAAFGLSNAQIGGLMSATAIIYAPAVLVAGRVVDVIGARWGIVGGTLFTGVCVAAPALAGSYGALLILLALSGLGCSFIYPSVIKALVDWFPRKERATALGVNHTAVNAGGILGAVLLPIIASAAGWRYGFLLAGCLAVLIAGVNALFYREPAVALELLDGDSRGGQAGPPGKSGLSRLLRLRDLRLLAIACVAFGMVEFAVLAHLVLYLQTVWGYSVVAGGGMLALVEAAGALGKPLLGLTSDRLLEGRRRPALFSLMILGAVICLALAAGGDRLGWAVYGCLLLLGVAIGWGGLLGVLAGELGGTEDAGAAAGLTGAMVNVGILAGPPLFGAIVDRFDSYTPAWGLFSCLALVAAGCVWLIREPARRFDRTRPIASPSEEVS